MANHWSEFSAVSVPGTYLTEYGIRMGWSVEHVNSKRFSALSLVFTAPTLKKSNGLVGVGQRGILPSAGLLSAHASTLGGL